MKLSANYNKVNIITSLIVFLFTGVIYYLVIHSILTDKLDKDLVVEEDEIRLYAETNKRLPLAANFIDQKVTYQEITKRERERVFAYTNYYDEKENEKEPGRSLFTTVNVGDKLYRVTITKSRVESEDLLKVILLITSGVTLIFLLALLLVNRFLLQRLWSPFYSILKGMKSFKIADSDQIKMEPTKIDEFNELEASVNAMAQRVQNDYQELKSFTDNASHEMMTPLAVINSKLDSLLQTESYTQEQGKFLQDIYYATGKLSRLHQSLLLLAKIENDLIPDVQEIDMGEMLHHKLRQFQELFDHDGLNVKTKIGVKNLQMSRYLADILLNNLFSNAIKHNIENGEIEIILTDKYLQLSNTGKNQLQNLNVFDRFSKATESEGMGLGLAITKQICNLYDFEIEYQSKAEKHYFTIYFKSNN